MARITFVDESDEVIGAGTKQDVWTKGIRHRIVRIFVLNSHGDVLLAQRGHTLESLPGRWNESAAGHVDEGEDYQTAAERETGEELGIAHARVEEVGRFKSDETDEPDKQKKRWTAVYVVRYDGELLPSTREVAATKWMSPKEAMEWMEREPSLFTEGCILAFKMLADKKVISL